MVALVRIALSRPYTFVVLALLLLLRTDKEKVKDRENREYGDEAGQRYEEHVGQRRVTEIALRSKILDEPFERQHLMLVGTERGREVIMRTPMDRFGELEELIGAAVFLASDSAGFVTGQTLHINGGAYFG